MSRILVVDDDSSIRAMLQSVLSAEGHEIVTADEGASACARMRQVAFDLVITDIVMQNQDGIETILAIRREWPHVPIVAISGGGQYAWTDVLDAAALFGASRTLVKPFAMSTLLTCIRELVRPGARSAGEPGRAA